VDHDYLVTGEMTAIRENGATSGAGVLATYTYDNLGRRTGVTRGNGTASAYSYDAASRLTQLTQDLAGSGQDLVLGFAYNPAGQIASATRSNDVYAFSGGVGLSAGTNATAGVTKDLGGLGASANLSLGPSGMTIPLTSTDSFSEEKVSFGMPVSFGSGGGVAGRYSLVYPDC
jgi:YD repeat-containing protein